MDRVERIFVLTIMAALITGALVRLKDTTDFVKAAGSLYLQLVRTFSGTSQAQKVVAKGI